MNEKGFYKKLLGEKWFSKEALTLLLGEIGDKCKDLGQEVDCEDVEKVNFDKDGIELVFRVEEYCGRWCGCFLGTHIETKTIYWEDLIEHFFNKLEQEAEKENEKKQQGV